MNRRLTVGIVAACALALGVLTGCTAHVSSDSGHGTLSIAANEVRISVPGAAKAYVQSGGGLVIGRRTVPLSPAGQELARRYYRYALGVMAAGVATGKAGGRLGVDIVGSLFSALWHGDSSIIKHTAHSGAAKVRANVQVLCTDLAGLETAQNALAADQPAFAPYRVIRKSQIKECLKGAHRDGNAGD